MLSMRTFSRLCICTFAVCILLLPQVIHQTTFANDSAGRLSHPSIPNAATSITIQTSYEAVNDPVWRPGEPTIAAGPSSIVLIMNSKFAVYDKSNPGVLKYTNGLSQWFDFPSDWAIYDPHVVYDPVNQRFVMLAMATNPVQQQAYWLVSVSKNQNPELADWCGYRFDASSTGNVPTSFAMDRPNIAIDGHTDILYLDGDILSYATGVYQYHQVRALRLSELYNCQAPPISGIDIWDFWNADGTKARTMQPARRYNSSGDAYYINTVGEGSDLTLWKITTDLVNESDQRIVIHADPYAAAPNTRQPGTKSLLNPSSPRILQAQFQGDFVWATHNIKNAAGTGTAIRTYRLALDGTGTIMPDRDSPDVDFTYPAFVVDGNGNFVTVFNRSSPSEFLSIRHAQFDASLPLKDGEASYTGAEKWGDYAGAALDPNGRDYWLVHTYAKTNDQWGVWVGSTYQLKKIFVPVLMR